MHHSQQLFMFRTAPLAWYKCACMRVRNKYLHCWRWQNERARDTKRERDSLSATTAWNQQHCLMYAAKRRLLCNATASILRSFRSNTNSHNQCESLSRLIFFVVSVMALHWMARLTWLLRTPRLKCTQFQAKNCKCIFFTRFVKACTYICPACAWARVKVHGLHNWFAYTTRSAHTLARN